MTTLPAPDLTLLRTGQQEAKLYLSIFKPATLLTALINEPSAIPGQRQIDYDGGTGSGFALIEGGQPLLFNGRKVRIKSITGNQTSGTIALAENSEWWADNAPITIQHDYPLFPILPSFDSETEEFFKDIGTGPAGVAYTDENSEPPPVCLAGVQAFVGWYTGITETLSLQVSQSSDDAKETGAGTVTLTDTGILVNGATQWMAARFQNVTIPPGAVIASAVPTVNVPDASFDDSQFNIYLEDVDDAPTFATGAGDISARARTTAFAAWSATGIGTGLKAGPDLTAPLQEVIDRAGWASGNDLALIFDGLASCLFAITAWDGSPSLAMSLAITFTRNVIFHFDLSDSYPVAEGATLVSYSASAAPAAGIAISLNTATGIGTITCSTAGQWIVKFGCTDSNGKTQYIYRAVMTNEPYQKFVASNPAGSWDALGFAYTVTVSGDATLADFPDQALAVLWLENKINGVEDYINIWAAGSAYRGANTICPGYIQSDSAGDDLSETGAGTVSFRVETPESLLATCTDFGSLELEAVANPTDWYQYASWLTVGRAIHHHLKWHSTAMEVMEIWGLLDNDFGVRFITFTEASLLQRDNNLAFNNGINAKLVCDRLGRLHLVRDSQLLGDSERAALDTVFTVTAQDIAGQFTTARQPVRRVVQTVANGFTFDGTTSTPLLAIAPGNVPENAGTGRINRPGQVLEDQDELNERTGRFHNVANAALTDETLTFRANYLGAFDIIPSLGFYEWDLLDNALKRQLALNGQRLIARTVEVSLTYEESHFTGVIGTTVTFEWEVEGESGQTDTYPGFPFCPPGAGTSRNIEEDPTPGDELADEGAFPPVALMAFSSANYRLLDGSNDWAELAADTVLYGTIDKFWVVKANSYDPAYLITWISGAGFIKELAGNTAPTVTDRTPVAAPPDSWSDTPDPAIATCSYIQIESDWYNQDELYTLAMFQNGSSQYRGWVGKRLAGNTFAWLPLYNTGGAAPTQSRPIFMAVTCSHVLVTVWQDLATDKLKLLVFTKSPFAFSSEVDLGNTSAAELTAKTYLAFPVATPDYSAASPDTIAPWYVAGRLNSPAGLSGVKHVITYDGAWAEVDLLDNVGVAEAWGTDYCGSLVVGPDDPEGREYWAARQAP